MNKSLEKVIRNTRSIAQYAPHRVYAVMLVAAAVAVPSLAIFAYGPERPTYTIQNPADHITFNSITDNPNYGDERNFVLIKDASNTNAGGWSHSEINVEPGKEYMVRVYVHNNAAANLNLVANNTRVMANVPTTTGNEVQIDGFVSADNATPQQVWDDVVLKSDQRFNVAYVPGSAEYVNNANINPGFKLPDSIVTNQGALVGYEKMDGNVPGCFQYAGIATFKVKVQGEKQANFEVTKQVRKHSEGQTGNWQKNVTVNPGEKVDYLVSYTNTGESQQDNVVIKDSLPTGVTYTNGTTKLANAQSPSGVTLSDGITTTPGVNIGSYLPTANAFATFTADVDKGDSLQCGNNVLRNTAYVETDNGTKSDYADITVNKKCDNKPSYTCDALQATKISQLEYSFNVKLSSNLADAKEVYLDFGDGTSATRDAKSLPVSHTYTKPGQYTITAKASFDVNGETVSNITSDACKVMISTETPVTPAGTTTGTTPSSLPSTGPVEVFGGILGLSALGAGIQQWIASRRAVAAALHHK